MLNEGMTTGVDHFFQVGIGIDIECEFQASAAVFLWDVMCSLVVIYRRFEETFGPVLQGQAVRIFVWTEDGTDKLSRNVGKQLRICAA